MQHITIVLPFLGRILAFTTVILGLVSFQDARGAEIELSAGYTSTSPGNDSYASHPAGYLISAVIGGKESFADFGLQYEKYNFTPSDAEFSKGDFQILSLVIRKPFWISDFFIGPTIELGVMNVEELSPISGEGTAKASSPLIVSYGLRGGYRYNSIGIGADWLYRNATLNQMPEDQYPIDSAPKWNGPVVRTFLSYWF